MNFRRVSIIGTLAAVALALLVILPVLAADGLTKTVSAEGSMEVGVFQEDYSAFEVAKTSNSGITFDDDTVNDLTGDTSLNPEDTAIGPRVYVSNDPEAFNLVFVRVARSGDSAQDNANRDLGIVPPATLGTVQVNPSSGPVKDISVRPGGGQVYHGYFWVVADLSATLRTADRLANAADLNNTDNALYAGARGAADAEEEGPYNPANYVASPGDGQYLLDPEEMESDSAAADRQAAAAITAENTRRLATANQKKLELAVHTREIEAVHGDSITITAGQDVLTLYVDSDGPDIENVTPDHDTLQRNSTITFGFTVTDDDSGLRTDMEDPFGGAPPTPDPDEDNRLREPLAEEFGYAADIDVNWNVPSDGATDVHRVENRGSQNWVEEEENQSYSVDFQMVVVGAGSRTYGEYEWNIEAIDRAGNTTVTDSDVGNLDDETNEPVQDNFEIKIDAEDPVVSAVEAGIGFDARSNKRKETNDASSIRIIFDNEKESGGIANNTIDVEDFNVTGHVVSDVIHPNRSTRADPCDKNIAGVCIDTRNRVYLVLSGPLGNDEQPEVQVLGGAVRDKAGNGNASLERRADDRTVPSLTISVTGDVSGASGRPLTEEDIVVRVVAGERLLGTPQAWLITVNEVGEIATVSPSRGLARASAATNTWTSTFDATDFGLDTKGGLGVVYVTATDRNRNMSASEGYDGDNPEAPKVGDALSFDDLEDAGLLVEFDSNINPAAVEIAPDQDGDPLTLDTESIHPFLEFAFDENSEYTAADVVVAAKDPAEVPPDPEIADTKPSNTVIQKEEKFDVDSYNRVTITALTIDGVDMLDRVARVNSYSFDLALSNLAEGEHTVEYSAVDAAGNEGTWDKDFEVLERSAYEVDLRPGWNLMSFPGDPIDTAIDSVLPADHPATDVLTYEAGVWTSAGRGDGNVWEGDLTDIDGQHAYWINTTSTKEMEAVLVQPGIGAASRPPSIQLITGWNLIPVTDLDQDDKGALQPTYFSSMKVEDFVVGYTYDAKDRQWERLERDGVDGSAEGEDPEWTGVVSNGQGVWVYSPVERSPSPVVLRDPGPSASLEEANSLPSPAWGGRLRLGASRPGTRPSLLPHGGRIEEGENDAVPGPVPFGRPARRGRRGAGARRRRPRAAGRGRGSPALAHPARGDRLSSTAPPPRASSPPISPTGRASLCPWADGRFGTPLGLIIGPPTGGYVGQNVAFRLAAPDGAVHESTFTFPVPHPP